MFQFIYWVYKVVVIIFNKYIDTTVFFLFFSDTVDIIFRICAKVLCYGKIFVLWESGPWTLQKPTLRLGLFLANKKKRFIVRALIGQYASRVVMLPDSGGGFWNDLRETLTYGQLLKHKFYLILRTFGWVSYSNSFIKCLCNRACCILIYNFVALGKIRASNVHHKLRSPVNRSRIRALIG